MLGVRWDTSVSCSFGLRLRSSTKGSADAYGGASGNSSASCVLKFVNLQSSGPMSKRSFVPTPMVQGSCCRRKVAMDHTPSLPDRPESGALCASKQPAPSGRQGVTSPPLALARQVVGIENDSNSAIVLNYLTGQRCFSYRTYQSHDIWLHQAHRR
jgi:hypothetical protein